MVAPADRQASASDSLPLQRTRPLQIISSPRANSIAAAFETFCQLAACKHLALLQISSSKLCWMSAKEELLAIRTVTAPSLVLKTTGIIALLEVVLLENLSPAPGVSIFNRIELSCNDDLSERCLVENTRLNGMRRNRRNATTTIREPHAKKVITDANCIQSLKNPEPKGKINERNKQIHK